jgi:hypothetical protein
VPLRLNWLNDWLLGLAASPEALSAPPVALLPGHAARLMLSVQEAALGLGAAAAADLADPAAMSCFEAPLNLPFRAFAFARSALHGSWQGKKRKEELMRCVSGRCGEQQGAGMHLAAPAPF